ncbi:uncharacterized protein LOC129987512 [Argiope bruennichi]|uniref:uncharacterized protein LOC129987512 n=1 Tax=Argiope bruennichi TaxID=94029 RepID=UPI002494A086|nr:uncharacterized protein LOC129987512 [Argiope bruennichi]
MLLHNVLVVGKGGNYAVLRGSSLRLSCLPKETEPQELREAGNSYNWTDQAGRELIDARFIKLDSGDLEIVNAHVGDSGIYKCTVQSSAKAVSPPPKKVYEHKLIVYELSGHKFVTTVFIDMSKYSKEVMLSMLRDLLAIRVCAQDFCSPGHIRVVKCELSETKQEVCQFSIAYEAISQLADERCDEECVRAKMFDGLKKAEKILQTEFMKMYENPLGRIKADMKTFDTHHLITCRGGFHLVKSHYKRCFPCLPGYYSEPNSINCSLCNIGYYQEHYGKHECDKCDEDKTTETMGAKSKDECVSQATLIAFDKSSEIEKTPSRLVLHLSIMVYLAMGPTWLSQDPN